MKRSNGAKTTTTARKSSSSSTKSRRSPVISKSSVSGNSESAAAQLDGVVDRAGNATAESEAGDRVLETPGISEGKREDDLSSESLELTAITLHQPWASLIAAGHKQYETRDWPTNHRGPILIHAGRKPKGKQELREHDKVVTSFKDLLNTDCAYSAVIAIAELTDVICMTEEFIKEQSPTELRCGNWAIGRYAFKLENIRAIAPIPATGKQGLWKWNSDSWNLADFGELQHKAEADGQLNLLEWEGNEPPDPDDYKSADAQTDEAEEELANFGEEELCDQLMDGSTYAAESVQDSPTPESNCGEEAPTSSVNGTVTASESLKSDSLEQSNLPISNLSALPAKSPFPIDQKLSPLPLPANPSAMMEKDAEPTTTETASPTCSEQLQNCSPTLQSLKTLPDSSLALIPPATNQEPISDSSSTPYPQSGSMLNGMLSAAPSFPAPGVEKDYLLLRSPGGLSSSGETRPPGKSRLETQLNQLGLIQDGEVAAPEFLESGYHLPIGFTNLQENRSAMELSQVQAQQLPIAHKSELPAETETTEIEEKPSETPSIGGLQQLDSNELSISLTLPPNIGSLGKAELISLAQEQHQIISLIERKQFELAVEKIHRIYITGVYLIEFKKRCQYGEFLQTLESHGIGSRSAQEYMLVAKNWETLEAKARAVALLPENNRPTLGIKWALEAIREDKKQLKKEAPPKDPDNWRTPNNKEQPVVSLIRKALGGDIWLDPCSDSSSSIPASMRYYKQDDGLAQHNTWSKTVFINPPFSDPFPWVERCCFEFARGNVSAAIMLLKAGVVSNVGTGELINKYASAICHWRGRINFLNDEGNPIKGSDFDCVLIYFGARLDLFRQNFGGRGTIATIENHYSSVNKKFLLKSEIPEFGNTQAEQKHLAAAVGLGNGRSVLPDMRDSDRERMERYDPHTVVDVLSVPPSMPATPISNNLVQPIGEPEVFDETPLATRQLQKAKENCLNDYVTAISGNISEFSDEQIAFLAKIINEESAKRIGF